MAGENYTVFFRSRTADLKRGARDVQDELDRTGDATDELGAKTRRLGDDARRSTGDMAAGVDKVTLGIGAATAAALKLIDILGDVAREDLSFEAERRLAGLSADQAQAVQYLARAGGLGDDGLRDYVDFVGALQDKAGEVRVDPAHGFTFDFAQLGLDPRQIEQAQDPGQLIDYLARQLGPGPFSQQQIGAIDRLFSGDKRVLGAALEAYDQGYSYDRAFRDAEATPDVTRQQRQFLGQVEQNRAQGEAIGREIIRTLTVDLPRAVIDALGISQPSAVEVRVDNPAFAVEQANQRRLGMEGRP